MAHTLVLYPLYFERDPAISLLYTLARINQPGKDEGSRTKKTSRARNPH
jgi:hypothetical protein